MNEFLEGQVMLRRSRGLNSFVESKKMHRYAWNVQITRPVSCDVAEDHDEMNSRLDNNVRRFSSKRIVQVLHWIVKPIGSLTMTQGAI